MRLCEGLQECFQNQLWFLSLVENLRSNHEEAYTRMILHAKHASKSYDKYWSQALKPMYLCCVSLQNYIDGRIYLLTRVKNSGRIIEIKAVGENLVTSMNVCNVTDELFLESIIVFHSFRGCETVSTFSGRGKAKPFKLTTKSLSYIEAFSMFGKKNNATWFAGQHIRNVCMSNIWLKKNDVDNVRYCILQEWWKNLLWCITPLSWCSETTHFKGKLPCLHWVAKFGGITGTACPYQSWLDPRWRRKLFDR